MSVISSNQILLGLIKGTTWGTEVRVTGSSATYLFASAAPVSAGFADFLPRDVGRGAKRFGQARLQCDVTGSISCDTTYGQGLLTLLGGFLGTESSPVETTMSQGDYMVTFDLADSTLGNFWTLAWSIETDRVLCIPSIKITGATYKHSINQAGTWTFQFIGDRVIESSLTSPSDLSGLTIYPYETATIGGANHYFRINTQSGSALAMSDEKTISGFTLTMTRPNQTRFGLRGANTQYTLEPIQLGPIDGALNLEFTEVDNATLDMWGQWQAATKLKAEFFIDGTQIGTGVNRSYKLQFPLLQPKGKMPTGHDLQNNNSLLLPTLDYGMFKALAAPSGMTGVVDLIRVTAIDTRATKWSA